MGVFGHRCGGAGGCGDALAMSGTQKEKPLLAATEPEAVRVLETAAVAHPGDPRPIAPWRRPTSTRGSPAWRWSWSRAASPRCATTSASPRLRARAVDEGRNDEALTVEKGVLAACQPVIDGGRAAPGCDTLLLVSAMRRTEILGQLVALGVEDAQAHPEASLVAYQNATREARVVVE